MATSPLIFKRIKMLNGRGSSTKTMKDSRLYFQFLFQPHADPAYPPPSVRMERRMQMHRYVWNIKATTHAHGNQIYNTDCVARPGIILPQPVL